MPLTASATAGFVLFGVFVAAFLVLAVITLRWAVRRDRAGRAEWVSRRDAAESSGSGRAGGPRPGRGGQRPQK